MTITIPDEPFAGHIEMQMHKVVHLLNQAMARAYGADCEPDFRASTARPRRRDVWEEVAQALQENPKLTTVDLIRRFGCSERTIEKARRNTGLYSYRGVGEKHKAVLDALAANPEATPREIAEIVGGDCDPPFVRFVKGQQRRKERG